MIKWLFVIVVFAGFMNWYFDGGMSDPTKYIGKGSYSNVAEDITASHEEDVVLYATKWCGYCKKTRAFLENKGIAYFEYDVERSDSGREQYDRLNGTGVPLLVVNSEIIRGYNTQAIISALDE